MPSSGRTCRDTGPKNRRARAACVARTNPPRSAPDEERSLSLNIIMLAILNQSRFVRKKWMECSTLPHMFHIKSFNVLKSLMFQCSGVFLGQMGSPHVWKLVYSFWDKEVAWRQREGLSGACIAITEWEPQPWEQSLKSADEAVSAAPILSALCVQALTTALWLPTSSPLLFVFQFLLLFRSSKWDLVGVDGVMWLQINLWAWQAVLSVQLLPKYVWSPDVMCDLNTSFHL